MEGKRVAGCGFSCLSFRPESRSEATGQSGGISVAGEFPGSLDGGRCAALLEMTEEEEGCRLQVAGCGFSSLSFLPELRFGRAPLCGALDGVIASL